MSYTRRTWLTAAGEPLLIASDPLEQGIRYGQFLEHTGLPHDLVFVNNHLNGPVPFLTPGLDTHAERCAEAHPTALWHPTFWLPNRVANRYRIEDTGDLETDDVWAVRIALELQTSGLYDIESGTWLDMLAYGAGLDIESTDVQQRLVAWQQGASDPAIDRLVDTCDGIITDNDDPDWAIAYALDITPRITIATYAIQAEALREMCDDVISVANGTPIEGIESDQQPTADQALFSSTQIAQLGDASFRTIANDEREWWRNMIETVDTARAEGADLEHLVEGPVSEMLSRIEDIRDEYWPEFEAMVAEEQELLGEVEPGSETEPASETV